MECIEADVGVTCEGDVMKASLHTMLDLGGGLEMACGNIRAFDDFRKGTRNVACHVEEWSR